jgi:hypothetical protein
MLIYKSNLTLYQSNEQKTIIPDTTEEVIKITSVVIQGVIHRDRTFQKTEKMEISMLLLPVLN